MANVNGHRHVLPVLCVGVLLTALVGTARADIDDSWEAKALFLQHKIDKAVPLRFAFFPHTHNSYNNNKDSKDQSRAYNHQLSVRDQLAYGIRSLTFDVIEDPNYNLCHGACLATDMTFKEGLDKIINFLDASGNQDEVVHLRLSIKPPNKNTGDWLKGLRKQLNDKIGGRVYTPKMYANGVAGRCTPFKNVYGTITKATIRAAGKNVIITADEACRKNELDDWVFQDDFDKTVNLKKSEGSKFESFPVCTYGGNGPEFWNNNFVRAYESRLEDDHLDLDYGQVHKLVGCGFNAVAPAPQTRDFGAHEAQVWSWAKDYPKDFNGATWAYLTMDDKTDEMRIMNTTVANPAEQRPAACRKAGGITADRDANASLWKVSVQTTGVGSAQGQAACAALGGGYTFAMPHNGYEMNLLRLAAKDVQGGVWVNYQNPQGTATRNAWVAVTRYQ